MSYYHICATCVHDSEKHRDSCYLKASTLCGLVEDWHDLAVLTSSTMLINIHPKDCETCLLIYLQQSSQG